VSLSTKKWPPEHVQKSRKLAIFAQSQFNSMNICLFSMKLPILVKISHTIIEILAFNKWFSKVYRFHKRVLSYLRWATRGGVVQIWPRDHQCCSYSVASSSACVCESRPRTFWTLFM